MTQMDKILMELYDCLARARYMEEPVVSKTYQVTEDYNEFNLYKVLDIIIKDAGRLVDVHAGEVFYDLHKLWHDLNGMSADFFYGRNAVEWTYLNEYHWCIGIRDDGVSSDTSVGVYKEEAGRNYRVIYELEVTRERPYEGNRWIMNLYKITPRELEYQAKQQVTVACE